MKEIKEDIGLRKVKCCGNCKERSWLGRGVRHSDDYECNLYDIIVSAIEICDSYKKKGT